MFNVANANIRKYAGVNPSALPRWGGTSAIDNNRASLLMWWSCRRVKSLWLNYMVDHMDRLVLCSRFYCPFALYSSNICLYKFSGGIQSTNTTQKSSQSVIIIMAPSRTDDDAQPPSVDGLSINKEPYKVIPLPGYKHRIILTQQKIENITLFDPGMQMSSESSPRWVIDVISSKSQGKNCSNRRWRIRYHDGIQAAKEPAELWVHRVRAKPWYWRNMASQSLSWLRLWYPKSCLHL
jgi:hypothetical protein